MTTKSLHFWVRCAIIAIALCGITICTIWYPLSFSLIKVGFVNANVAELTTIQSWALLSFFWIVSIPCFIVLIFSWKVSANIKTGQVFTVKVAKIIKLCAQILFIDIGVFFVGNVVFLLLKINDFALLYFFLIMGGLVLAVFLSVLSYYAAQAAELKEISEGTV